MQWFKFIIQATVCYLVAETLAAPTHTREPGLDLKPDAVDKLAADGLQRLKKYSGKPRGQQHGNGQHGKCTLKNAAVRRSWTSMPSKDRKRYLKAVKCLMSRPPQSDPGQFPGAKTRYDDFVAVHMHQTFSVHETASFLSWHRYFIWNFERALREECGYTGHQPYWNWGKTAKDPLNSVLLDGSDASFGGDGESIGPHVGYVLAPGVPEIPSGNGGGCVKTGPFKDMTINMGPVLPTLTGIVPLPFEDWFSYNPRCLRRDINPSVSSKWSTIEEIVHLITQYNTIEGFQKRLQGDASKNVMGVHSAGHFTIGGDPGGDLLASPADPLFFVHHGMVDRVWWIWQNLGLPGNRGRQVTGTLTMQNLPPSRNGTVDDTIQLGVIAPKPIKIRDIMSTVEGPFCYIYE